MMSCFHTAHPVRAAWALLLALVWCAAPSAAAVTPQQIDNTIEKARQFIYSQQQPSGRWEKAPARIGTDHNSDQMQGDTYGGYTALATYALLASGESPNSPRVKAAIEFLKQVDLIGIYAIGMRLQVWLLIPHNTSAMKALIRKDAEALARGMGSDPTAIGYGMWDYLGKGQADDHSVSQYGVLGLWAAQQTGAFDVGKNRWKVLEEAWRRDQQQPQGSWCYRYNNGAPSLSMTAAGVASLFITADYLHGDEGIGCTGTSSNDWIDKGLAWIDKHYSEIGQNTYTMYGIERIGAASGYKFFAGHDWYADLSERLVKTQKSDGSWNSSHVSAQPLDSTCFALLFLSRGRAPVIMNKLDYRIRTTADTQPAPANWDERPRDAANLAVWAGHETETFFNWQIVNLLVNPDQLHDAPILYMSGNQALMLRPEDAKVIKTFIEQGGMVLANADCGRTAFAQSFEQLGKTLFNQPFRDLPADHPAYTHEQFPAGRWKRRPAVRALSNGVRELMVLLPESDPARWWQVTGGSRGHEEAYELGTDLYQYSLDRKIWNKGAGYIVRPDPSVKTTRKLKLARLQVGTNWDPEPGGWTRMAAILHNDDHLDLSVFKAVPGQGALAAAHLAHLTGTTDFTLNDSARLELTNFVKQGGTLVVDAAGGSPAFADAAERELQKLFGTAATDGLATPLPPDHALYNIPGHKIDTFGYRSWARLKGVGNLKAPRVCGIEIGNRIAVFFSREDLSAGIVGEPVDGIMGYTPETATDIMRNIILYATERQAHK